MAKKKNLPVFLIKFAVSFVLIAFILIFKTSVSDVLSIIKGASIFWLAASFSLHAIGLLVSAYRWQILIHAQDESIPLGFLVKSYLVGTFFGIFLPTRIGADAVRIWDGSRYSRSLMKSSAVVLVDRLTGIIVLFVFALTASLFRLEMARELPVIWVALLLSLLGLFLIALFFIPVTTKLLERIPERGILLKVRQKIFTFRETIFVYRNKKSHFFKALFWAFILQVNVIFHYYMIGKALHLTIHIIDYFIFVPVVLLILVIPITINGLGLREGLHIEIFKFYGISASIAVSFALIDYGFILIVGAVGGIVYILRK